MNATYVVGEEERFCLRLQFEPGDIQFLQNHVVFHSRTSYLDAPEGKRRHLMRIWLSLPDGRRLPDALAEKWINIEVGTRRSGVPTNTQPVRSTRSRAPTPDAGATTQRALLQKNTGSFGASGFSSPPSMSGVAYWMKLSGSAAPQ